MMQEQFWPMHSLIGQAASRSSSIYHFGLTAFDIWMVVLMIVNKGNSLYIEVGINREGFEFNLAMHGQNVFHLTPLQQICPLKNLEWVF